jgi:hypothetical protein
MHEEKELYALYSNHFEKKLISPILNRLHRFRFCNAPLSCGLIEIRQGCRRKSYSGNHSLSPN